MPSPSSLQTNSFKSTWLQYAIFGLDRWLRQRQGVYEYTSEPRCLFRIQRGQADADICLSDGTHIIVGDPILSLHIWNEHVPAFCASGASMAWARQLNHSIRISLYELMRYLADNRDLKDVVALRAEMRLGTAEQTAQLIRISSWYGFEAAQSAPLNTLHRFSENFYLLLLVLATNPLAIGMSVLRRDHALVYLSRAALERQYGHESGRRDTRLC